MVWINSIKRCFKTNPDIRDIELNNRGFPKIILFRQWTGSKETFHDPDNGNPCAVKKNRAAPK